jgi:hypothetical protein
VKNTFINREATKKVAKALGNLNAKVVYVGGAMVGLYIDDPAAEDIRPTKDIDLTFQVASYAKLEALREALINRGFTQSAEDRINCRFRYEDLIVDVMATEEIGWAPSNPWFKDGFEKAIPVQLDQTIIRVLPLPFFLATKLAAFFGRGIQDVYASPDLEDLVYLFNYTTTIDQQVLISGKKVRKYIQQSLRALLEDRRIVTAMEGHLYYEQATARMEIIRKRFKKIMEG